MSDIEIRGHYPARYQPVVDAFAANFESGADVGGGFAAAIDGEVFLDIRAGYADKRDKTLWDTQTLVPVYSTTKGVGAIVAALMVERGLLSYDQKVSDIWPDFTGDGRENLTIAEALSHQSGLAAPRPPMDAGDWFDWDGMCTRLCEMEPWWRPGDGSGYHPVTWGFLAGEIVRRADGRTLGTILREDICQPHDIDFHIGLPASEHDRCAAMYKPSQMAHLGELTDLKKAAFLERWSSPGRRGAAHWREAEFAAANGHGTAGALARLYGIIASGGYVGGDRLISKDTLNHLMAERCFGEDRILPYTIGFAAGLCRNEANHFYGPGDATVGHSGWGGSCAFADPETGLSAAYVMNQQAHFLMGDPRTLSVIDALYGCL